MIVNPKKIQALIMGCDKKTINKYTLNINDSHIPSEDSDILSGVEMTINWNLKSIFQRFVEKHVAKQLNAISRIGQKRKGNYNKLFGA